MATNSTETSGAARGGFLRDTARNALGSVMLFGARFVALAVIARLLGVEMFGTVALAILCVDLMVLVALAGLPGVISRFLPITGGEARAEFRKLRGRWLAYSVAAIVVAMPVVGWAVLDLSEGLLVLLTLWAVASAAQAAALAEMQGALRFELVVTSLALGAVVLLLGAGAMTVFPSLTTAFVAFLAGHLAQLLPWFLVQRREVPPENASRVPMRSEIMRYGLNVCIAAALTAIVWNRGELFVIEIQLGETVLGQYGAAVTLTAMVWRLTGLLQGAVTPHLARRLETETAGGPFLADMTRLTMAISTVAALGIALCGTELVLLVFGSAYAPAGVILTVMAPGIAMAGINTVTVGVQLMSNGRVPRNALIAGAAMLISLAWLLAQSHAAEGAALARAVTMSAVAAVMPLWLIWSGSGPLGRRILTEIAFAILVVSFGSAIALFTGLGTVERAAVWLTIGYAVLVRATGAWSPSAMLQGTLTMLRAL